MRVMVKAKPSLPTPLQDSVTPPLRMMVKVTPVSVPLQDSAMPLLRVMVRVKVPLSPLLRG